MSGNNRIRIINTTFVVVSRLEFTTSVSANMSRIMIASPKSVLNIWVLLLLRCRSELRAGQIESSTIRYQCPCLEASSWMEGNQRGAGSECRPWSFGLRFLLLDGPQFFEELE